MISLQEKVEEASVDLLSAVYLVHTCITSASRHVTDSRLERIIKLSLEKNISGFPDKIQFRVRKEAVDIFEGPPDDRHAHIALNQSDGNVRYWRNIWDDPGPHNFPHQGSTQLGDFLPVALEQASLINKALIAERFSIIRIA